MWYGYVTSSTELAKTIIQGTRKEIERDDRERGWRMEDNITEWTEKAFSDNLRRAKDKEKWRELVVRCCDAAMVVRPRDID